MYKFTGSKLSLVALTENLYSIQGIMSLYHAGSKGEVTKLGNLV